MPTAVTTQFGLVDYPADSELEFPHGLPAFESEGRFIVLRFAQYDPLVFLQSLSTPSLAFLAIEVQNASVDYTVDLSEDDVAALGSSGLPSDFDLLALITVSPSGAVTANLQAPIVIHRSRRRAVQSIQSNPAYSCRHPLGTAPAAGQESPCL